MPVYRNLLHNTKNVSPGSIKNASSSYNVYDLNLNYDDKQKEMSFFCYLRMEKNTYSIQVKFLNIERVEGLTEDEIAQGFQPKPSLSQDNIQVKCSCASYIFRFNESNLQHGSGIKFPLAPYHRKTNRKPNNPKHLPGFCKHVYAFIEYLSNNGFIH